jgi:hypothetical protein
MLSNVANKQYLNSMIYGEAKEITKDGQWSDSATHNYVPTVVNSW